MRTQQPLQGHTPLITAPITAPITARNLGIRDLVHDLNLKLVPLRLCSVLARATRIEGASRSQSIPHILQMNNLRIADFTLDSTRRNSLSRASGPVRELPNRTTFLPVPKIVCTSKPSLLQSVLTPWKISIFVLGPAVGVDTYPGDGWGLRAQSDEVRSKWYFFGLQNRQPGRSW